MPGSGSSTCLVSRNVRDEFATVTYSGNGPGHTDLWAGSWTEADGVCWRCNGSHGWVRVGQRRPAAAPVPALDRQRRFLQRLQHRQHRRSVGRPTGQRGSWTESDTGTGGAGSGAGFIQVDTGRLNFDGSDRSGITRRQHDSPRGQPLGLDSGHADLQLHQEQPRERRRCPVAAQLRRHQLLYDLHLRRHRSPLVRSRTTSAPTSRRQPRSGSGSRAASPDNDDESWFDNLTISYNSPANVGRIPDPADRRSSGGNGRHLQLQLHRGEPRRWGQPRQPRGRGERGRHELHRRWRP